MNQKPKCVWTDKFVHMVFRLCYLHTTQYLTIFKCCLNFHACQSSWPCAPQFSVIGNPGFVAIETPGSVLPNTTAAATRPCLHLGIAGFNGFSQFFLEDIVWTSFSEWCFAASYLTNFVWTLLKQQVNSWCITVFCPILPTKDGKPLFFTLMSYIFHLCGSKHQFVVFKSATSLANQTLNEGCFYPRHVTPTLQFC